MSTLSRLFNFQAGTAAVADDVDSEFNQIIDLLNGTSTNKEVVLKSGATAEPVLKVQKTSTSGNIIECLDSLSAVVASISESGQLTLAESTDPPLVVSSSNRVNNLNAQFLNGRSEPSFIRDDIDIQIITGSGFTRLALQHPSANSAQLELGQSDGDNRYFVTHTNSDKLIIRHDDGTTLITQLSFDPVADSVTLPGSTELFLSGAPTQDLHAATKKYVDDQTAGAGTGNLEYASGDEAPWGGSSVPTGFSIVTAADDRILSFADTAAETKSNAGSWTIGGLDTSVTVNSHTLTTSQIPSHNHSQSSHTHTMGNHTHDTVINFNTNRSKAITIDPEGNIYVSNISPGLSSTSTETSGNPSTNTTGSAGGGNTGNTGGGGSHNHGASANTTQDGTWRPRRRIFVVLSKS